MPKNCPVCLFEVKRLRYIFIKMLAIRCAGFAARLVAIKSNSCLLPTTITISQKYRESSTNTHKQQAPKLEHKPQQQQQQSKHQHIAPNENNVSIINTRMKLDSNWNDYQDICKHFHSICFLIGCVVWCAFVYISI